MPELNLEISQKPLETLPDLEQIVFKLPNFSQDTPNSTPDTYQATFNGSPIDISVAKEVEHSYEVEGISEVKMTVKVSLKGETELSAQLEILLEGGGDDYQAHTSIMNPDSDPNNNTERKLKGIGAVLWTMSFPIIQRLSNKLNAHIYHIVEKKPFDGFKKGDWDKKFLPILQAHGYKPDPMRFMKAWFKNYTPPK